MLVKSSNIQMQSFHHAETKHKQTERLNVWVDTPAPSRLNQEFNFSQKALDKAAQTSKASDAEADHIALTPQLQVLKLMLEKVFNRKFQIFDANTFNKNIQTVETFSGTNRDNAKNTESTNPSAGYGIEYDYHESYEESETTNFSAVGQINTLDGQQIKFSVTLNMSREYSETIDIRFRGGNAKLVDPLVVNFSGNAAELSQTRFSFDLNADGQVEEISYLKSNSGFLALDKNNDGQINNGAELFGGISGDGFLELSQYDEDGNHFIDSNDSIYHKLQVWRTNENGEESLQALVDLDIGAIYLDNIATSFNVNSPNNQTLGKIQATSLYFKNTGEAGTIQKLDFVV